MVGACLESGQDLGDMETVLTTGPRDLTIRVEVSPLLNDEGRPGGVIILLHDLSHEKGAVEAAVTGDLSLRLSPAGLAHEVKNPLTGIKGAAELMAGMFPDDGRAQQYCSVILDGVNRIASLVEQVLMVSGPQRLAQEPVNIHMVLHQAMRMAGLFPQPPAGVRSEPYCLARRAGADGQRAAAPGAGAGQHPHGAPSGDADGWAIPAAARGRRRTAGLRPQPARRDGRGRRMGTNFAESDQERSGSNRRVGHDPAAYPNRARIPDDRRRTSPPIPASRGQRQRRRHCRGPARTALHALL